MTTDSIRAALMRLIKLDDAHEGDRTWEPWSNAIAAARAALAAALPRGAAMTTPTIRAALERLVEALDDYDPKFDAFPEEAMTAARAALAAAPEGEGPSEGDVADLFYRHMGEGSEVGFENAIAEALARWGRPAAPPAPPAPLEGEMPSDDEMAQFLFDNFKGPIEFICDAEEEARVMIRNHIKFARAVLARWGRPAPVQQEPPADFIGNEKGFAQEHLARLMRDAIGNETNYNAYIVAAGKILDRPEFAYVAQCSHHAPLEGELTDKELLSIASDCRALYVADDNYSEVLAAIAAAIAAPPAPPEGEVGELVQWLRSQTERYQPLFSGAGYARLTRAATLLQQQAAELARLRSTPPEGEVGELVAKLRRLSPQNPLGTADPTITRAAALLEQLVAPAPAVVPVAIPGEQWHEDDGACLWWRFPIEEPPWAGDPRDDDWPGYHTHFTRIVCPVLPAPQGGEVG